MPAPVPLPIRQALCRRWALGATTTELARAFDLPARTVRHLLRRWQQRGPQALAPDPSRAGPRPPHPAFESAIGLRRDHPQWGAGLIRVYLAERGVQPLPGERTLLRWFHQAGLAPAPPGRLPVVSGLRAAAPHEIWEVDAAEEIPLGDGQKASWLRIVDEYSGAVLQTTVFPPRALEFRARDGHPRAVAAGLPALGDPAADARRQWNALGLGRGPAHRPGAVADRPGRGDDLEPAALPPGQRGGGTFPGHG